MLEFISSGYILLAIIIAVVFYVSKKARWVWLTLPLLVSLWTGWEYIRPYWITGSVSTETNAVGNADIYICSPYWCEETNNDDVWWWGKLDSTSLAGTTAFLKQKQLDGTALMYGWRAQLMSWQPNLITIGKADEFNPWLSWRVILFYTASLALWGAIFLGLFRATKTSTE